MKKQQQPHFNVHGRAVFSLALCTALAFSSALFADDHDKNKDKEIGAPGSASSSQAGKSNLNSKDEKFIRDAARGGQMEIHMGKLGVQKAQNPEVKQFAQKLVDDHTKASQELKQIASTKGITLPDSDAFAATSASSKDSDRISVRDTDDNDRTPVRDKSTDRAEAKGEKDGHHAAMKKLHDLSGTEFDREFVRAAINDHEKDVKEFEKASQQCEDAELKSFAQKTLPVLREHLQKARSLQASIGGSTGTSVEPGANTGGNTPALPSRSDND